MFVKIILYISAAEKLMQVLSEKGKESNIENDYVEIICLKLSYNVVKDSFLLCCEQKQCKITLL